MKRDYSSGRYTTPSGGRTNMLQDHIGMPFPPRSKAACQDCDARGYPIFPHRLGHSDVMYRCDKCIKRYFKENGKKPITMNGESQEFLFPGSTGLVLEAHQMINRR